MSEITAELHAVPLSISASRRPTNFAYREPAPAIRAYGSCAPARLGQRRGIDDDLGRSVVASAVRFRRLLAAICEGASVRARIEASRLARLATLIQLLVDRNHHRRGRNLRSSPFQ
jgi:hypothetical protein